MSRKPTDRIQVLPRPIMSPGKCIVCGSADREVIDFGMDLEYYGVPYFCCACIIEAATKFDVVPGEHYRKLEDELNVLKANTEKVQQYVDDLSSDIARSSADFLNRIGNLRNSEIKSEPVTNNQEPSNSSRRSSKNTKSASGQNDSVIVSEGPDDVSTDTSVFGEPK